MEQEAKEHLNNIRMVKPDKAEKIEMAILKMMQQGVIQTKISKVQNLQKPYYSCSIFTVFITKILQQNFCFLFLCFDFVYFWKSFF